MDVFLDPDQFNLVATKSSLNGRVTLAILGETAWKITHS